MENRGKEMDRTQTIVIVAYQQIVEPIVGPTDYWHDDSQLLKTDTTAKEEDRSLMVLRDVVGLYHLLSKPY